uniref:RNA-directed DNA polymerase n=1 Tax=Tanacetum cinerariifolium TaxID=118510 RepID=A0A6L2JI44_TANCI|nr:DNA-directed DNA polymerase [Tanacetum cinerariifolium]
MVDRTMEELLQTPTEGIQTSFANGFPVGGNLLSKTTREALKIIENKSKVRYSRSKSNVSRVNTNSRDNVSKTDDRIDKLADQISNLVEIVNKQVITPATAKAIEKTCVICGGAHANYDCIATDSNQPSVCVTTGSYNQVSPPNRASHQIPPPGFAPLQNNPNRYNRNQGQGNNFNRGNNFQNNQGYRAPLNNALNFQNQGFQNQPFQVPNNQVQPGIPNELSSYMKSNEIMVKSMQNQINVLRGDFNKQEENLRRKFNNDMISILGSFFQNQASTLGTLSSNIMPNPKGEMKVVTTRSGLAYEGPSILTNSPLEKVVEQDTEEITDKEHSNYQGSTAHVQPLVVHISIPKPDVPTTQPKPNIPYPSRLNDQKLREKATYQMEKFFQIFHDLHFNISFADALLLIPKFASTIKSLLTNKDKLFELAKVPLNENCSAMLLKKLPEKLGDLGKFLIPYDFPRIDVCHALADLGTSINLMPLLIWKNLSLPELTLTRMTLELADRLITRPKGVAEDKFVKVGKFHFPTDFVVVDFKADPRVPLILGRSFLRTGCALIDVYGEEITLRVNDESVTFNLNQTIRYSLTYDDNSVNRVDVIDIAYEEFVQDVNDFFLEQIEDFLNDESIPMGIDNLFYDPDGDILYLEKFLNEDPFQLPPMDLKQVEKTKEKSSIEEPPELELKELPSHLEYAFLEDTDKLPISDIKGIDLRFCTHKIFMEEDYKPAVQSQRRPVGESNSLCAQEGWHDVLANKNNEFIPTRLVIDWRVCIDYRKLNDATRKDHFSLPFVDQMLERLVRNEFYCFLDGFLGYFQIPIDPQDQEKTTFTCPYGTFAYRRMPFGICNAPGTFQRCMIAIFHDMIEKTMEVFMDDFSVFGDSISSCLTNLDKMLKRYEDTNLVLNWGKCHFMCREGIVLGHKILKSGIKVDKAKVDVIAKFPHSTIVKGVKSFLAHAVYAFEKFRRYLVWSKSIVHADHSALKYLLNKQDAKPRLLWWVLLLQEFDITILDKKKGSENHAVDHLSRLENPHKDVLENKDINKNFSLETLGSLSSDSTPWFADIANFHAGNFIKKGLTSQQKKKFFKDAIIRDRRTHFYNYQFTRVMIKYEVIHRLATAYHPQKTGQVKVSNRGLKRILERTVGENRASCHAISIELEHRAYWALKHVNFDLKTTGDHRKLQLNELRDQAYENSVIYKERTKKLHDSKIKNPIFNVGDQVLLFNSHLKIFSGKLKTHSSGPFTITQVFLYGTVELSQPNGPNFKVNGHRVKHYFEGYAPQ